MPRVIGASTRIMGYPLSEEGRQNWDRIFTTNSSPEEDGPVECAKDTNDPIGESTQ